MGNELPRFFEYNDVVNFIFSGFSNQRLIARQDKWHHTCLREFLFHYSYTHCTGGRPIGLITGFIMI